MFTCKQSFSLLALLLTNAVKLFAEMHIVSLYARVGVQTKPPTQKHCSIALLMVKQVRVNALCKKVF